MPDSAGDKNTLRQMLAAGSTKLLGDLLREPEIKAACLDTLTSIGCRPPANHLVFFCLSKVTLGTSSLLGVAAASRLEDWLLRIPAVEMLFLKLLTLDRQESDREKLRHLLLAELNQQPAQDGSPRLDIATPPEVLSALYQKQKLENLSDEFADLLKGLQDGVGAILTKIDERNSEPQLLWPVQQGPTSDRSITDTLRYNSMQYEFLGREPEVDFLDDFLGDISAEGPLARFSWLLITGPGGEGKTRLAFEFSKRAEHILRWKSGRMSHSELENFDAARWQPRRPTCIMIDYPAQVPEQIGSLLSALQERCVDFDWPVRVLMMERDAEGDWFKRMLPEGADQSAIIEHACVRNGHRLDRGWALPPMRPGAIIEVMRERFVSAGIEPPDPFLLLEAASQIDPRADDVNGQLLPVPRPLFAMAAAEALILAHQKGETDYAAIVAQLDREEVLARLIDRDRDQRWTKAHGGVDATFLALHENLYALATFCLGLSRLKLKTLPAHVLDCLPDLRPNGLRPLSAALMETMSGSRGDAVPGLEPDILGEFFVLRHLSKLAPDTAQALRDGAFAFGDENSAIFVLRCFRDFPEQTTSLSFLAPAKDAGAGASRIFGKLSVDLAHILGEACDWARVEQMLSRQDAIRAAFPNDIEIAILAAKADVNIIYDAGTEAIGTGDWTRVEQMLARLDALRAAFPDDPAMALEEAKAAFNVVNDAGTEVVRKNASNEGAWTGDWTRVERMFARIDALRAGFPDERAIALEEAKAAVNTISDAGNEAAKTGDWTRVEQMLNRLDLLRAAYPADREFAVSAAKAALNITGDAGAEVAGAGDWTRVQQMLARLDVIRGDFPDDREIAVRDAKATYNIANHAGNEAAKTGDWTRSEQILARLDALRAAFADEREIAIEEAKMATSFISYANIELSRNPHDEVVQPGDETRVPRMLGRLDALRSVFPNDREIAVQEAKAATNIFGHVRLEAPGTADPARMQQSIDRLNALGVAFPNDREIAAEEAKCILAAYIGNRLATQPMQPDAYEAAAQSAIFLVSESLDSKEVNSIVGIALQVIKDCRLASPGSESVEKIYRACEAAGMDFTNVRDIRARP